jgi:hypothetical protein
MMARFILCLQTNVRSTNPNANKQTKQTYELYRGVLNLDLVIIEEAAVAVALLKLKHSFEWVFGYTAVFIAGVVSR